MRGLSYKVEFTIKSRDDEKGYIRIRETALRQWARQHRVEPRIPPAMFSGIPLPSNFNLDIAVPQEIIETRALGVVFCAFDSVTGDPRAIKKLTAHDEEEQKRVKRERNAHQALGRTKGIVRMYGYRDIYGERGDPRVGEDYYLVTALGPPFTSLAMRINGPYEMWSQRAVYTFQLLIGLEAVHLRKAMLRNIRQGNILLVHEEQFEAVFSDFSNFWADTICDNVELFASFDAEDTPPDVDLHLSSSYYDQKIDIWMLAEALVRTFMLAYVDSWLGFRHDWNIIHNKLDQQSKQAQPLAQIYKSMLTVEPHARPSASEILENQGFQYYFSHDLIQELQSQRYKVPPPKQNPQPSPTSPIQFQNRPKPQRPALPSYQSSPPFAVSRPPYAHWSSPVVRKASSPSSSSAHDYYPRSFTKSTSKSQSPTNS